MRHRWRAAWAGLLVACGVAGCNALAGIQSGELVAGADGGSDAGVDVAGDQTATDTGSNTDSGPGEASLKDASDSSAPGCDAGQLLCANTCVPNDLLNCGSCGHDCTTLPHVDPLGEMCTGGHCTYTCATGYGDCADAGAGCATSLTQNGNCGMCGKTCSGNTPNCAAGTCVPNCTGATPNLCGTTCTNTQTDLANCGACNMPCTTGVSHAMATCMGGHCGYSCLSPYVGCNGACVDETSDPNNCGGCGASFVCPAPTRGIATCGMSVCGVSCNQAAFPTYCSAGHACVDTSSDNANCGVCGNACTNATCAGGHCVCNSGFSTCGSACIDLMNDGSNCGACGHSCAGATCSNGACQPIIIANTSGYVFGVTVDSTHVYFTTGNNGAIESCPVTGACTTPQVLFTPPTGSYPTFLFEDVTGARLFATDNSHVDGVTTAGSQLAGYPIASPMGNPWAITGDGATLYWAGSGGVASVAYGGTSATMFNSLPSGDTAFGITWDAPSSRLYVGVNSGTTGYVMSCTAGGICARTSGSPGFSNPWPVLVVGSTLYLGAQGTSPNYTDGGVYSVAVGNIVAGPYTPLATGVNYARTQSFASDGTSLYFASFSGPANIYKCALPSCASPVLWVAGLGESESMAVDANWLYFGSGSYVGKVPK